MRPQLRCSLPGWFQLKLWCFFFCDRVCPLLSQSPRPVWVVLNWLWGSFLENKPCPLEGLELLKDASMASGMHGMIFGRILELEA